MSWPLEVSLSSPTALITSRKSEMASAFPSQCLKQRPPDTMHLWSCLRQSAPRRMAHPLTPFSKLSIIQVSNDWTSFIQTTGNCNEVQTSLQISTSHFCKDVPLNLSSNNTMPAATSSIPKSSSRLPTTRTGILTAPGKTSQTFLTLPAIKPGPKSPTVLVKGNSHRRSPSKLPKSPGLKSTSSNPQPAQKKHASSTSPPLAKKVGVEAETSPSAAEKASGSRPASSSPSQTTKPNITVTLSPPETPKKPHASRVNSSNTQVIKPANPASKDPSPYISAHLGEPCTLKSLDHLLDCDHKIITTQPESCASNCRISNSAHSNPRSLDQSFACLACIVAEQQAKHAERVSSFKEELEHVAKATKKPDPQGWIVAKVGLMAQAWRDLENEEMIAAAKEGRFCYPVYVDQENQSAMVAVVGARLREKARKQIEVAEAVAGQERV